MKDENSVKKKHSRFFYLGAILLGMVVLLVISAAIYVNMYYKSVKSVEKYALESDISITEEDGIISVINVNKHSEVDEGKSAEKQTRDDICEKKSTEKPIKDDIGEDKSTEKPVVDDILTKSTGLIMYPGAKVEYSSYIPLMELLAKQHIDCYIVNMPCNLAILDTDAANKVINTHKNIEKWYIMGHSLGGAVATSYIVDTDVKYSGVILLGAYPMKDMSNMDISMLSIVGTCDGVINRDTLESNKTYEPNNVKCIELNGANHANYGDYGLQKGDKEATISATEQRQNTADIIIDFINGSIND